MQVTEICEPKAVVAKKKESLDRKKDNSRELCTMPNVYSSTYAGPPHFSNALEPNIYGVKQISQGNNASRRSGSLPAEF